MSDFVVKDAKCEIDSSLTVIYVCLNGLGISFDATPKTLYSTIADRFKLIISIFTIIYHCFSDVVYIAIISRDALSIENIIPYVHTSLYAFIALTKIYTLWYKRNVFGQLIRELSTIWPMPLLNQEVQELKKTKLKSLYILHQVYSKLSVIGLVLYSLTPIVKYFYLYCLGEDAHVEYMWASWYPFDKYETVGHVFVYIFEVFVGIICILVTIAMDLLYSTMASHISMLLGVLNLRLRSLNHHETTDPYQHIVENIKLHQRLIRYCNDLEDAFSFVNFINVMLNSVIICCVSFIIALVDPVFVMSNKIFLIGIIVQTGLLCWYGDDIYIANAKIGAAAYESHWVNTKPCCRRALMLLICRSQKAIGFTAMKFTTITLSTFSTILSRSYSYFALLYTIYQNTHKQH